MSEDHPEINAVTNAMSHRFSSQHGGPFGCTACDWNGGDILSLAAPAHERHRLEVAAEGVFTPGWLDRHIDEVVAEIATYPDSFMRAMSHLQRTAASDGAR